MWFLAQGMTIQRVLMNILAALLIIFLITPLHECAHAYVAYKLGDDTAKRNVRMTLNPLAHIDPLGAASILLFQFGWAQPVPVDSRNFKHPRLYSALVAIAGPIANLLAAFLGAVLFYVMYIFRNSIPMSTLILMNEFISAYISINVTLAVFNLLPIPPLDGSQILVSFLPKKMLESYYKNQRMFIIIVFMLMILGVLSAPIAFLSRWVTYGIGYLVGLLFGL